MKKIIFLSALMAGCVVAVSAQDKLFQFFPNQEGFQLVNQTYNAENQLVGTNVTTVQKYYEYTDGAQLDLGFTMIDPTGKLLDEGSLEAYYEGGNFYLKMNNRTISPEVMRYLSAENELVGDFLDYPNPMGVEGTTTPVFAMNGGDFTVRSKENKREFVRVHNFERELEGRETITTPAGTFEAFKVASNVEVTCEGKTERLRQIEWYAPQAGIVRAEVYNGDALMNYTVLAEIRK